MRTDHAAQCALQVGMFGLESATRQIGELRRVRHSANECLNHRPPRQPEHTRSDRGQLYIGTLQYLLDTVAFCGAFSDQRLPIANQFTQLTLGATRHEARFQESPWRSKSAIHSASLTSVFLPGIA